MLGISLFFSLALFFACNPFSEHLEWSTILFLFKPLNPNIKIQLLILCPYMFSMEVVQWKEFVEVSIDSSCVTMS